MKHSLLTMASILAALALSASPALARGHGTGGGGHAQGHSAQGGGSSKGGTGGGTQGGTALQVTLSNPGDQPLAGIHIGFSGKDNADFSEQDNCHGRLGGGDSCTINVTFKPKTRGSKSATLEVSSSQGTESVALSGEGI